MMRASVLVVSPVFFLYLGATFLSVVQAFSFVNQLEKTGKSAPSNREKNYPKNTEIPPSLSSSHGSFLKQAAQAAKQLPPSTSSIGSEDKDDGHYGNDGLRNDLQRKVAPIAASFEPSTFQPWIKDCHVQTIGGFFLRGSCSYVQERSDTKALQRIVDACRQGVLETTTGTNNEDARPDHPSSFWDHRERIDTADGDWFHADTKFAPFKAVQAPTVILLHGLQSSSSSTLSMDMAAAYYKAGMNCVCLNFRGCSGIPNDTVGAYHLGFCDDLLHYLNAVMKRRWPHSRVYLSGFSLGANVVLKTLGDLGEEALTKYNIYGAAVLCPPLDQVANAPILARPDSWVHRNIYTNNLLKQLKELAEERLERYCAGDPAQAEFDYEAILAAKTITEFDDAFIAPIYGFQGALDYYEQTSCIHVLHRIAVPTLLLAAADDPFMDGSIWPVHVSSDVGGSAPLKMSRQEHGGHLGFCFHQVPEHDQRLVSRQSLTGNYLGSTDQEKGNPPNEAWPWSPSWASSELARFVRHIQEHPETNQLSRWMALQQKR